MRIRPAARPDVSAITRIYNHAVTSSTASFDVEPRSEEDRERWLAERLPRHPVVVAEEDGQVLGWGALSRFSERTAYDATAEISVYIDEPFKGRGLGRSITLALLEAARDEGLHAIIARICTENVASIRMVSSLGFTEAGTIHEVGCKFGRWLDVVSWEYRVSDE